MSGAKAVREDRLWQRHADMAKLGGTPKGGVNRQALSAEDAAARNLLASWAKARGFSIFTDAIGNLFVRREGSDATALPVMSGSHMDSQPTGGRFDGMYGVLAAFEALEALEDAGVKTRRPVMAVAWTNEEGSRFQPGAMGSAVFAGRTSSTTCCRSRTGTASSLKDALAEHAEGRAGADARGQAGLRARRLCRSAYRAGPAAGERAQDDRRGHRHPGQPALHRRDRRARRRMPARRRAPPARMPLPPPRASPPAMYEATTDADDTLRFTIGRVEVHPGSPNTVPGKASFTIDMRHPSDAVLEAHEKKLCEIVASRAAPCTGQHRARDRVAPTDFDPKVIDLVRAKAEALKLQQHGHAVGRGPRRHAHRQALPRRHDLRALRARHQPQRGRERHARRPRRRRARAGRGAGRIGQSLTARNAVTPSAARGLSGRRKGPSLRSG